MSSVQDELSRYGTVERVDLASGVPAASSHRMIPLDALRGIAIALVIVHHVWFRFPNVQDPWVWRFVAGIGWAGVDLFFAISGFLITTILLRTPAAESLRPFYIKRAFRIVPLYTLAVTFYLISAVALGLDKDSIHRIWVVFVGLTAWAIPFFGENGVPFTITWSISVEELAYILLGGMLLMIRNDFIRGLQIVVVSALLVRVVSLFVFSFEPVALYYFAPGRLDAVAMGGVAATLSLRFRQRIVVPSYIPWLAWLGVVAACSYLKRESPVVATFGYSAIAIASAWLVLCIVDQSNGRSWTVTRWLAGFGLVSYFIYLFHGFVIGGLALLVSADLASLLGVGGLSVFVSMVTFIFARVSWEYLERPLIDKGRRVARSYRAVRS